MLTSISATPDLTTLYTPTSNWYNTVVMSYYSHRTILVLELLIRISFDSSKILLKKEYSIPWNPLDTNKPVHQQERYNAPREQNYELAPTLAKDIATNLHIYLNKYSYRCLNVVFEMHLNVITKFCSEPIYPIYI